MTRDPGAGATARQPLWLGTLRTLHQRFREDRLAMTAGSLTFTTLISIVPLVTVLLALFSALPLFSNLQGSLQRYFLRSLIPDSISQTVLGAVTQFSARASRLGSVGLLVLVLSVIALMLTIDRALNAIWRIERPRPLGQRVLIYWAAVTLGPLLVGLSLTLTSYAVSASRGLVDAMPEGFGFLLGMVEFVVVALGFAGLFHVVPNTAVRWRHAVAGGLFVAIGLAAVRQLIAFYLSQVPTFAVVYGAFATLPIFLIWIYVSWIIVLLGAVITADAPMLRTRLARWSDAPGTRFRIALAVLGALAAARAGARSGLTASEIAEKVGIDPLQSQPVIDQLIGLGWVGRLDEAPAPRHVLLCDPALTPLQPLVEALLVAPAPELGAFWARARLSDMSVAEAAGA
nr:YihY family inner membrane protein [Schlegelella koreensis]